jgi:hypothetical protein
MGKDHQIGRRALGNLPGNIPRPRIGNLWALILIRECLFEGTAQAGGCENPQRVGGAGHRAGHKQGSKPKKTKQADHGGTIFHGAAIFKSRLGDLTQAQTQAI